MRQHVADAIREAVEVPTVIAAIASAIASDLMSGPHTVLLPDGTGESFDENNVFGWCDAPDSDDRRPGDWYGTLYTSPAADLLRDFIGDLPVLYIDEDGYVHTSEPSCEPIDYDDEDDEYGHHGSAPGYDTLDNREVAETLFGRTIAREFR